jgi:hypothetical protein
MVNISEIQEAGDRKFHFDALQTETLMEKMEEMKKIFKGLEFGDVALIVTVKNISRQQINGAFEVFDDTGMLVMMD